MQLRCFSLLDYSRVPNDDSYERAAWNNQQNAQP